MRQYNSNAAERALFRNISGDGEVLPSWAALLFQPDGQIEIIALQDKEDFTLDHFKFKMGLETDDLLQVVEASVLTMLADVTIVALVDEEGLLKELEHNPNASAFAGQDLYGAALFINKDLWYSFDEVDADDDSEDEESDDGSGNPQLETGLAHLAGNPAQAA